MMLEGVTGANHAFNWDGKDNYGNYLTPAPYTYNVSISQLDTNAYGQTVWDHATYRSTYLQILRASDDEGNPIFEAEFHAYDEEEDKYIYIIRRYVLKDSGDLDASEGELLLFDPDMTEIDSWSLEELNCLEDGCNDGKEASAEGIRHSLLVRVPAALMQSDLTYTFVLHIKDNHAADYRDHRKRWAFNMNQAYRHTARIVLDGDKDYLPLVDNTTKVQVRIVNQANVILEKARVPVTISVTPSRLPGFCSNYPKEWPTGDPPVPPLVDMTWPSITGANPEIEPDRNAYIIGSLTKTIYSHLDEDRPGNEPAYLNGTFDINLKSYDYGGRIRIQASKPSGWDHVDIEIARDPQENPKRTHMWVPEDFDEDRLPDAWERQYPNLDLDFDTDEDAIPDTPDSNIGDGFRAFDEYRGFQIQGNWKRLDPTKKELFINSELGVGNAATATGFIVYEVDNSEMWPQNNMALNNPLTKDGSDYTSGRSPQKGIRITDAVTNPSGTAFATAMYIGTPNQGDAQNHIHVYTQDIQHYFGANYEPALRKILTHEIGHNLNLVHCTTDTCAMFATIGHGNYMYDNYCLSCKAKVKLH